MTREELEAAARADMMDVFNLPKLNVQQFRKLSEIASLMCPLLDCIGQPSQGRQVAESMLQAENRAPRVYALLLEKGIGGNETIVHQHKALAAKYEENFQRGIELSIERQEVRSLRAENEDRQHSLQRTVYALEQAVRELPAEVEPPAKQLPSETATAPEPKRRTSMLDQVKQALGMSGSPKTNEDVVDGELDDE